MSAGIMDARFVQISTHDGILHALDENGTVWLLKRQHDRSGRYTHVWQRLLANRIGMPAAISQTSEDHTR